VLHTPLATGAAWTLLVPGFTGSKEDFIAVLAPLAEVGIAAVALDQRGQYQSPGSGEPRDYTLDGLAADLVAVLDCAAAHGRADSPHLLGHSFGGLVCQAAVGAGATPASLTLLCSGPGALPVDRQGRLAALIAALSETGPSRLGLADLWTIRCADDRARGVAEPPPPIAAFLRSRWLANDPVGLREMAGILCHCGDLTGALLARCSGARADLPVHVLWGEHDDAWPIDAQRAMAQRLRATAVEVPGAGHSPAAEDPLALLPLLRRAWTG